MLIPEFIHFYHYTLDGIMGMYSRTFFSLVNAMNRLQGKYSLANIGDVAAATHGDESYLNSVRKQERGLHGIVQEVRIAKRIRK